MDIIEIIDTKDPRALTFKHRHKPLRAQIHQAIQAVNFMRGVIEDSLEDDNLTDEEFDLFAYVRNVLADNLDSVIEKSNFFAIEANRVLEETESG